MSSSPQNSKMCYNITVIFVEDGQHHPCKWQQYADHYHCWSVPIFTAAITVIQIGLFTYYCLGDSVYIHQEDLVKSRNGQYEVNFYFFLELKPKKVQHVENNYSKDVLKSFRKILKFHLFPFFFGEKPTFFTICSFYPISASIIKIGTQSNPISTNILIKFHIN